MADQQLQNGTSSTNMDVEMKEEHAPTVSKPCVLSSSTLLTESQDQHEQHCRSEPSRPTRSYRTTRTAFQHPTRATPSRSDSAGHVRRFRQTILNASSAIHTPRKASRTRWPYETIPQLQHHPALARGYEASRYVRAGEATTVASGLLERAKQGSRGAVDIRGLLRCDGVGNNMTTSRRIRLARGVREE